MTTTFNIKQKIYAPFHPIQNGKIILFHCIREKQIIKYQCFNHQSIPIIRASTVYCYIRHYQLACIHMYVDIAIAFLKVIAVYTCVNVVVCLYMSLSHLCFLVLQGRPGYIKVSQSAFYQNLSQSPSHLQFLITCSMKTDTEELVFVL